MNDAEYARQKRRILALSERWVGPLGLRWWDIDMAYARDDFEVNGKPAPRAIACTDANWRYGHATITWNMPLVAEQPDADLERAFVHELQHVFLNEARESDDDWLDHEERVATSLTKAFLWLRDTMAMDLPTPLDQAPIGLDQDEPTATLTVLQPDDVPPQPLKRRDPRRRRGSSH